VRILLSFVVLGALFTLPRRARAQDAASTVAAGYEAYRALDLDRAERLAGAALASSADDPVRARALVLRALVSYQRLRPDQGRADLGLALRSYPRVELPAYAPPSVRDDFESLRAPTAEAPPSGPPRHTARPATGAGWAAARTTVPGRPSLWSRGWFWSALGAGASLLLAGVSYAIALSTHATLESAPHEGATLQVLTTRFETARTLTLVGALSSAAFLALAAVLLETLGPVRAPPDVPDHPG
jgi:hypothetical protein